MKKLALLLTLVMLGGSLAGCGKEAEEAPVPETETVEEAVEDETEEEAPVTEEESQTETEDGAAAEEKVPEGKKYVDNFEVDKEAIVEFAEKIQKVVEEKDLEGLADLAAFPMWVGFKEEGISVETREDFLALGADKIFTEEMTESVKGADLDSLSPSMAGFSVCTDNGPNVNFGVRDGVLAINGMNY